jgi:hypothetical protein
VMLLNEFLKEHQRVEAQGGKIEEQEATICELKNGMAHLVTKLNEQAAQIHKVSTRIGISRSATKVTFNNP